MAKHSSLERVKHSHGAKPTHPTSFPEMTLGTTSSLPTSSCELTYICQVRRRVLFSLLNIDRLILDRIYNEPSFSVNKVLRVLITLHCPTTFYSINVSKCTEIYFLFLFLFILLTEIYFLFFTIIKHTAMNIFIRVAFCWFSLTGSLLFQVPILVLSP